MRILRTFIGGDSCEEPAQPGDPEYTETGIWEDPFEGAAVGIPIDDFIDLHTFAPDETRQVLEAYIEAARDRGLTRVRIIHGKGIGVQRRIVESWLENDFRIEGWHTAGPEEGGGGATIAILK